MGLQIEFNWYIVIKDKNVTNAIDHNELDNVEIDINKKYIFIKEGYRIYPIDTPLPLIYNGKCLALACVESVVVQNNMTILVVKPELLFQNDDPVAKYYEESFKNYKREQQQIDDGGRIDIRQLVNLLQRVRV